MYTFDAVKATNECVQWIKDWFEENGKGCNAVIGISGGKDSTVVAALCARALGPERVIGVTMPNGIQPDINDSKKIIDLLCINGIDINIQDAYKSMVKHMETLNIWRIYSGIKPELTKQATENLPPRLRMAALYMVAQSCNGRVSNNCNLSENWIGYSTIYGDTAGDFSPISNFTVSEVIEIGRVLGIPERFLTKPPADGLSGKTDEDKIGFTYAVLDKYIRTSKIDDIETKRIIDNMHERNKFKHEPMKCFKQGNIIADDKAMMIAINHIQKMNPLLWNGTGNIPANFNPIICTHVIDDESELDISFEKDEYGKWGHVCELRKRVSEELIDVLSGYGIDSYQNLADTIRDICKGRL